MDMTHRIVSCYTNNPDKASITLYLFSENINRPFDHTANMLALVFQKSRGSFPGGVVYLSLITHHSYIMGYRWVTVSS